MINTYCIKISGLVQGVGFRPFIFNLAKSLNLKGLVSNDENGVIIFIQGEKEEFNHFCNQIHLLKPEISKIISLISTKIDTDKIYDSFSIQPTPENLTANNPLTPDFATCNSCKKELLDKQNRRYFYPFTTCTQCGPRYSITQKFPFERENTSISNFEMCPDCLQEYQTPENIRFHSQTNTCPYCGIKAKLTNNKGVILSENYQEIFTLLSEKLEQGKIAAIKNTSGYLLICDATNADSIQELRKRKKRPTKPFAVLFPDIKKMSEYLYIQDFHSKELLSPEAPINIIKIKDKKNLAIEAINPNIDSVGAMYPYIGILELLTQTFKKPLIATSGNLHGSPICSDEQDAVKTLHSIADFYIHHNLEILHPQDDSVIKFSDKFNQKIILRRARGYAPNYLFSDELENKNLAKEKILCLGGNLKNSFTIVPNNHVYVSEYIGDLANFETYLRFEKNIQSYLNIFNFYPEKIIYDQHPSYENLKMKDLLLLQKKNIEEYKVPHHQAHFAAILGEHKLWENNNILGVIWDGTGYYSENEIWGSEFFVYNHNQITHIAQLDYSAWILGDKMSKNPKISALSISKNHEYLKPFFTKNEWKLYTKLIIQSEIKTSSMGRLFDAVSFVLGYRTPIHFEGEAALFLEQLASRAYQNSNFDFTDYLKGENFSNKIPTDKLLNRIINEVENTSSEIVALNFHYTLIKIIEKIAINTQIQSIAFSGGVFQNSVLVDLAIQILKPNFKLYFHTQLSPNDENISFGQLNHYLNLKTNT